MATNKELTAQRLSLELGDPLTELVILSESLGHVRSVLAEVAQDAEEKIIEKNQQYFLWENNDKLQMVDDMLFRLSKELKTAVVAANDTHKALSNEIEKEGEAK